MKTQIVGACLAAISITSLGCQFIARSPEDYERDTRALLEQNASTVRQCYESHLEGDESAEGNVVVKFDVEAETGTIQNVSVDDAASSAPAPLQECVATSITGLQLDPPDARKGVATFTYELAAAAPPPPPES